MVEKTMIDDNNELYQDGSLVDEFAPPSFDFEMSQKEGSQQGDDDILIIEEEGDDDECPSNGKEETSLCEEDLTTTERSEDDPSIDSSSNTNCSSNNNGGGGLFKFNLGEAWQGSTSALTKNLNNSLSTATTLFSNASTHSNGSSNNINSNDGNERYARSQSLPGSTAALDEYRKQFQQQQSLSPTRRSANRRATIHSSAVDCGPFEDRVQRLRYSTDDIFELVDDRVQFDELKFALRSMGVVTNTTLRLKLHWYVRNSKKDKLRALKQQQEQQSARPQLHDPMSSLVETCDGSNKEDAVVTGKMENLEISPRGGVRGVISSALRLQ